MQQPLHQLWEEKLLVPADRTAGLTVDCSKGTERSKFSLEPKGKLLFGCAGFSSSVTTQQRAAPTHQDRLTHVPVPQPCPEPCPEPSTAPRERPVCGWQSPAHSCLLEEVVLAQPGQSCSWEPARPCTEPCSVVLYSILWHLLFPVTKNSLKPEATEACWAVTE